MHKISNVSSGICFDLLLHISDTVVARIPVFSASSFCVISCSANKTFNLPTWFYGLGYWTRGNAEICLLAKRGQPKRHSKSVHQFIISPIEEHSKKPDITREKIIELAGDLPRVELFARQKTPGWEVWGNEVDSDVSLSVSETR